MLPTPWTRPRGKPIEKAWAVNPNGGKTNGLFNRVMDCEKGAFHNNERGAKPKSPGKLDGVTVNERPKKARFYS